MLRPWIAIAAVNALLAVAAGAFGAHGLEGRLSPKMLANFETGARYHMYHALAMLLTAIAAAHLRSNLAGAACIAFLVGILLFSGSLYVLAMTGVTRLGMVTPFGGLAFMVGWALLAWAAWSRGELK
jgi:uncharacterized membrane protein YgdD (TMEM256/DUF423 family)